MRTSPRRQARTWLWLTLLAFSCGAQAHLPGTTPPELTVASVQLPFDETSWPQRREQVLSLMQDLQPDVIAIQQVVQTPGKLSSACWLATRLRYSCDFVTVDPPSQALRHGNAMLTRRTVTEDGVTLLHPPGRYSAAGMLRLQLEGNQINVYVVRLRPEADGAVARQHQISDLMTWVAATADGLPTMIAGDFAAPTEELVKLTPGFQPSRRNPSGKRVAQGNGDAATAAHGMDVLYQVRQFAGISQQPVSLPALDEQPVLRLGMLATLRLALPEPADDTGIEPGKE